MVICGICKKEQLDPPRGLFFHAWDDWGHFRLFLCDKCFDSTPLQRSAHELCHFCLESASDIAERHDQEDRNRRFVNLATSIDQFEHVHQDLFAMIPFVSYGESPDAGHPGSAHPDVGRWLAKYGRRQGPR